MIPSWLPLVALLSSLVGWALIIGTLVAMIRTKRAQRLAREAAAAAAAEPPAQA